MLYHDQSMGFLQIIRRRGAEGMLDQTLQTRAINGFGNIAERPFLCRPWRASWVRWKGREDRHESGLLGLNAA